MIARVQVSKAQLDELSSDRHTILQNQHDQQAVYNTWYRKWAGGDSRRVQQRSPFKCSISRDSGSTASNGPYCCLWFARGACFRGSECKYLHRLPQQTDVIDRITDCFGRTKFAKFRDDMGGVGSFLHPTRTLFVGYFTKTKDLKSRVQSAFAEFGGIESVRFGKNASVAFVTFVNEHNAEFAREALANQTITGRETLTVRWARDTNDQVSAEDEQQIRAIVRRVLNREQEQKPEHQITESTEKETMEQDTTKQEPIQLETDASESTETKSTERNPKRLKLQ